MTGRPPVDPGIRFMAKVHQGESSACWEWQGARVPKGYGMFTLPDGKGGSVMVYAHRFSYTHHVGPIPTGLHVRHDCDNPPCVNPAHLRVGTVQDNMRDMVSRGRHARGNQYTRRATSL